MSNGVSVKWCQPASSVKWLSCVDTYLEVHKHNSAVSEPCAKRVLSCYCSAGTGTFSNVNTRPG